MSTHQICNGTPEHREYQRIWMQNERAKHPEKTKEVRRVSMKVWRERHPIEHNLRNKVFRAKWAGLPEKTICSTISKQHPEWLSFNDIKPDFYDHTAGLFIEIKRATIISRSSWKAQSSYFPNLFFFRTRECRHTPSLDEQIEKYPKPLLVIIYDAFTGEELTRKLFGRD